MIGAAISPTLTCCQLRRKMFVGPLQMIMYILILNFVMVASRSVEYARIDLRRTRGAARNSANSSTTFKLSKQATKAVSVRITKNAALNKFNFLSFVNLSNNKITAIRSGDLKLSAPLRFLDLSSNQISTIAAGSLPETYAEGAQLILKSNKLTQLDQSVFQPILDYFVKNKYPRTSTFISLTGNPLDCSLGEDSSNSLSWLITNSRSRLIYLNNAVCSNGNGLSAVDPSICTTTTSTTTLSPTTKKPKHYIKLLIVTWIEKFLNAVLTSRF